MRHGKVGLGSLKRLNDMSDRFVKTLKLTLTLRELSAVQRWLDCKTVVGDTSLAIGVFRKVAEAAGDTIAQEVDLTPPSTDLHRE